MKTERLYMTLYMCFIETLIIAYNVSKILAQIVPKLDLSDLQNDL